MTMRIAQNCRPSVRVQLAIAQASWAGMLLWKSGKSVALQYRFEFHCDWSISSDGTRAYGTNSNCTSRRP